MAQLEIPINLSLSDHKIIENINSSSEKVSKQWRKVIIELSNLYVAFSKPITEEVAHSLGNSPFLERIVLLESAQVDCVPQYWTAVGKMKRLISLDARSQNFSNISCVKEIAKLTKLESLEIGFNVFGDEGVEILSGIQSLMYLSVGANDLNIQSAISLCKLKKLISLDISYSYLGIDGAKIISGMTQLTDLDVSFCKLGDEGVKHIIELPNLVSLFIRGNLIGPEGAKLISGMKKLKRLDISFNIVGGEGANYLSEMKQLTGLVINRNEIGEIGRKALDRLKEQNKNIYVECDEFDIIR